MFGLARPSRRTDASSSVFFVLLSCVAGLALAPSPADAQCTPGTFSSRCTDGLSFLWDPRSDAGDMNDGTSDAFDGWPHLCVTQDLGLTSACASGDQWEDPSPTAPMLDRFPGGDRLTYETLRVGGLDVTRQLYVRTAPGEGWARYLEILENPSGSPVTVKVRIGTVTTRSPLFIANFGSDRDTQVRATDTGSTSLAPGQLWFVTDDAVTAGADPALAHVIDGPGGSAVTRISLPATGISTNLDTAFGSTRT